jgi:hypothetical protein
VEPLNFPYVTQCYEVSVDNNVPAREVDRGRIRQWKIPGVENDCTTWAAQQHSKECHRSLNRSEEELNCARKW